MAAGEKGVAKLWHFTYGGQRKLDTHPFPTDDNWHVLRNLGSSENLRRVPFNALIVRSTGKITRFRFAKLNSALQIGDIFMSGPHTQATIEFVIGGRATVMEGTSVVIASERHVSTTNESFLQMARKNIGLWVKADALRGPLEIQTNGGVMGIKG